MQPIPDSVILRAENERLQLEVERLCDERDDAQMKEAAALAEVTKLRGHAGQLGIALCYICAACFKGSAVVSRCSDDCTAYPYRCKPVENIAVYRDGDGNLVEAEDAT